MVYSFSWVRQDVFRCANFLRQGNFLGEWLRCVDQPIHFPKDKTVRLAVVAIDSPLLIDIPPPLMRLPISAEMTRNAFRADFSFPWLVDNVVKDHKSLVRPHPRMPVSHGLERVVLP